MRVRPTLNETLRQCQVFSGLSSSELDEIAMLATEKQYEAGTTIFRQGERAEEFFVLQDGKVALQMSIPEAQQQVFRRVTIDTVTKNEVFGWSAIVEPHIYTLTAVCLQNVNALSIYGSKLKTLLRDNPKIGYQVTKQLIQVVATRLDETRQVLISERLSPPAWNRLFSQ